MYKTLLCIILPLSVYSANPEFQLGYPIDIPNSARAFETSPTIIDLNDDGMVEIIFGTSNGMVYAYSANGTKLWQHNTGDASIDSKPAVADINNDGKLEVVVTSGRAGSTAQGLLKVLNGQSGVELCRYTPPTFSNSAKGVHGSVALANMDADPQLEIIFGDWGATVNVLNHDCSYVWRSEQSQAIPPNIPIPKDYDETVSGIYINDTVWSSPTIADINGDGQLDVIIGVDTHTDDTNLIQQDGGRLLVINGNDGTLIWGRETDEVIWSSPVIADIDNDGSLDIVVAEGYCYQSTTNVCAPGGAVHSVINQVHAWDKNGNTLPGWPFVFPTNYAVSNSSVAVADIDNDGFLEVVINAFDKTSGSPPPNFIPFDGKIFIIEHTGNSVFSGIPNIPAGASFKHYAANSSSPIIADVTGDGNLEILIPSNLEIAVFNNQAVQISREDTGPTNLHFVVELGIKGTPSVADIDGDGDYELIAISGNRLLNPRPASIYVWDLATSTSTFQPWPNLRNSDSNLGVYKLDDPIFSNGFE